MPFKITVLMPIFSCSQICGFLDQATEAVATCHDINKMKKKQKQACKFVISTLGTKTCLLCPQGQLQSLNCDKTPQLHAMKES